MFILGDTFPYFLLEDVDLDENEDDIQENACEIETFSLIFHSINDWEYRDFKSLSSDTLFAQINFVLLPPKSCYDFPDVKYFLYPGFLFLYIASR